jgi:hypothetical protein
MLIAEFGRGGNSRDRNTSSPLLFPLPRERCIMTIPTTCRTAAVLAGLVALIGCTDLDPYSPTAVPGETGAFASARKPAHTEFNETFSNEFPCGTFTGLSSGRLSGHRTTFFNQAGTALLLNFHFRYQATITNTASGKVLTDNAVYNGTQDLVTGVIKVSGVLYNVKDREHGIRIKDIGRIVFDGEGNITFQAGRHDVGGFGDARAQYCAALA